MSFSLTYETALATLLFWKYSSLVSGFTVLICWPLTQLQPAVVLIISPLCRHMVVAPAAPVHLPGRPSMVETPPLPPQHIDGPYCLHPHPGPPSCLYSGAWWEPVEVICGGVVTIGTASQNCFLCRQAGAEHGSHDTSDQVITMLLQFAKRTQWFGLLVYTLWTVWETLDTATGPTHIHTHTHTFCMGLPSYCPPTFPFTHLNA